MAGPENDGVWTGADCLFPAGWEPDIRLKVAIDFSKWMRSAGISELGVSRPLRGRANHFPW